MGFLKKLFGDYSAKEVKRVLPLRDKVLALEETYAVKRMRSAGRDPCAQGAARKRGNA